MVALCLGVEHLAGLLQLLGGDRRQEVAKEVKIVKEDVKEIRMVKERGQDDEERRQAVIKDQLHVLSTQVKGAQNFTSNHLDLFQGGSDKGESCNVERKGGSCSQCELLRSSKSSSGLAATTSDIFSNKSEY